MPMQNRLKATGNAVQLAALCACALSLAGCATGYSFVQPDMAGSGGYYTSSEPYAGQGYYDDYGTGPYYPGTSGWGYYNGSWSYPGPFGWYGGYAGGSWFTFGFSLGGTWGFPGYWGPWYSGGYGWRCNAPGCTQWRQHRHDGHTDSPQPWLQPDHPPVPPQVVHGAGSARPVAVPGTPLFQGSPRGLPARLPDAFVRAPIRRAVETGFHRVPAHPAYLPPWPREPVFANRRPMFTLPAMPRVPHHSAQPVFRSQPPPVMHIATPTPRSSNTSRDKIP